MGTFVNPNPVVRGIFQHVIGPALPENSSTSPTIKMPRLTALANELLDGIAVYLDPRDTAHLLICNRSLSKSLEPAMFRHCIALKDHIHPLHWAAKRGHFPLLQRILPRFPVNLTDDIGRTALHFACAGGNTNPLIVLHLLRNGAEVNLRDCGRFTALQYVFAPPLVTPALAETKVRHLLNYGANANSDAIHDPRVPLVLAIGSGLVDIGVALLVAGADPNWVTTEGNAILHYAVIAGNQQWFQLLLDHGADIDKRDDYQNTVLSLAVQYGQLAIVQMLVGMGVDIHPVNDIGDTPLIISIQHNHRVVAEYLIGLDGIDFTTCNIYSHSPLILAAWKGWDGIVRWLLEQGCPVDTADRFGFTPLHSAVKTGHAGVVKILLERGASVDIENNFTRTPLQTAIEEEFEEIVEILIVGGADPTRCTVGCMSPIALASQVGSEKIVGLLLQAGVDVNCRDKEGRTPMTLALDRDHDVVVEILVAHGGEV